MVNIMLKFVASNLDSVQLKALDRAYMRIEYRGVDSAYLAMWKINLAPLHLSEGEVKAFLQGKYAAQDDNMSVSGIERTIMRALYKYYHQSDTIRHSLDKAEATANKIFWYRGWPTSGLDENEDNELGTVF
jgi:hypothetical protein